MAPCDGGGGSCHRAVLVASPSVREPGHIAGRLLSSVRCVSPFRGEAGVAYRGGGLGRGNRHRPPATDTPARVAGPGRGARGGVAWMWGGRRGAAHDPTDVHVGDRAQGDRRVGQQ